jgi:hypothetical protein
MVLSYFLAMNWFGTQAQSEMGVCIRAMATWMRGDGETETGVRDQWLIYVNFARGDTHDLSACQPTGMWVETRASKLKTIVNVAESHEFGG